MSKLKISTDDCPGLAEPGELGVARAGAHPRLRVQQGGSQVGYYWGDVSSRDLYLSCDWSTACQVTCISAVIGPCLVT